MLALVGNLFYVLVYTRWLKRSTPQNIVIGGAAGAVPPLVGWAAATGHLDAAGADPLPDRVLLDAAALLGARAADQEDYAAAKVPMLPVVRGERETARQIVLYSVVLVAVTLRRGAGARRPGLPRRALALGAVFVGLAWAARRETTPRRAALLFHYSLLYLALLFVAMAIDPVVL